jgi:hypothetical protein
MLRLPVAGDLIVRELPAPQKCGDDMQAGAIVLAMRSMSETIATATSWPYEIRPASWSMTSALIRATLSLRSVSVAPRFQSGTMNSS